MAVTLPSWLQIDPIEPARIKIQANAQRNQAAASERQAQAQAQELQFRREQAQVQQAQEAGREAAQERAAVRRDQVLKQTNDRELASAAEQLQLKREVQAEKSQQFEQTLRMKQQQAEQTAKNAASQMQGMQAVQKGLKEGQPLQKLIAENAPLLFSGRADRGVAALQRGAPTGVTAPVTARKLMDEGGNDTGQMYVPGAHGGVHFLPSGQLDAKGRMQADKARLGSIMSSLAYGSPTEDERKQLISDRKEIETRLKNYANPEKPGASAPAPGAVPQTALPVTGTSDVVRVKSPDGKSGAIPRSQLAAALKNGYTELTAAPDASDEDMAPAPEDDGEE
jgi:hypothetical protein